MKNILLIAIFCAAVPVLWSLTDKQKQEFKTLAAAIEEDIKAEPKDAELYIKLGFIYSKLEEADKAQSAFEKAESLNPEKSIVHYMLGLIYEKKELKEKAIASWKKCLKYASKKKMKQTAEKHIKKLENQ